MPPRVDSRYQFSRAFTDADGRLHLEVPDPVRHRPEPDNVRHVVGAGESLQFLAYRYYRGMERPARFWWAIGAYNGVVDATFPLASGTVLVIPSERLLRDVILAPPPQWKALVSRLGGAI